MTEKKNCAREGCVRYCWDDNKAYCSSLCHFIVTQVDAAEVAARKGGDPDIVHRWFAAAVTLSDTVNELTELKLAYQQSLRRKVDV